MSSCSFLTEPYDPGRWPMVKRAIDPTLGPSTLLHIHHAASHDFWGSACGLKIFQFPKLGNLGIAENYWCITLTSIAAKIYNALQLNRIEPEIEKKFSERIEMVSEEIDRTS